VFDPSRTDPPADPRHAPVRRLLVTAGPTHEPIDAVRFIGNRSSGKLGIALAETAAERGWKVCLLLGPTPRTPSDPRVRVHRFQTTSDLQGLLSQHLSDATVLVMAAAVADFRPKVDPAALTGKNRRTEAGLTLQLEPTPDLLAGCVKARRPGQLLVGFALEPRDRLLESARAKLERKGIDLVVANPLETMDAPTIEATVLGRAGTSLHAGRATDGPMPKTAFAVWLMRLIEEQVDAGTP
jgi:phosphopantothenoylcysteine decarboxylase / phosphopantothenate---cysteine ligase